MKRPNTELEVNDYIDNHEAMVGALRGVISRLHRQYSNAIEEAVRGEFATDARYYAGIRDEAEDTLEKLESIFVRFT